MEHIKKYWWIYGLVILGLVLLAANWKKLLYGAELNAGKPSNEPGSPSGTIGGVPISHIADTGRAIGGSCTGTNQDGTICKGHYKIDINGNSYCDCGQIAELSKASSPSTHCIPRILGVACPNRICYVNGKFYTNPNQFQNCGKGSIWYTLDNKNSTATQCCYKKLI